MSIRAPAFPVLTLERGILVHPSEQGTCLLEPAGSAYVAIVFHDPGRDDHMGFVRLGVMRSERDAAWTTDDRFWQEPLWSSDVNALVWSPARDAVYVSTGDHGSGGVFRLDLRTRHAVRLFPAPETSTADQGPGRSCEILRADVPRRLLHVRYRAADQRQPVAVDVRLE